MANPIQSPRPVSRDTLVTIGIALAILAIIVYVGDHSGAIPQEKLVGKPAPPVTFRMPNGDLTSTEKKKGTVVLLNFWATWCPQCLVEMPSLKMLELHFKNRGFLLLSFNLGESQEKIQGSLPKGGAPSNLIFSFNKEAIRPYNVSTLPLSVLIDQSGVVRHIFTGGRNWTDISTIREIEPLL